MVESRWFRRAGPAVAALGGIALIATTTLGAPRGAWTPDVCAGAPRIGDSAPGSWYRIDPVIGRRAPGPASGWSSAVPASREHASARPRRGVVRGRAVRRHDPGRHAMTAVVRGSRSSTSRRGCAWPLGRHERRRPDRHARAGWRDALRVPRRPADPRRPRASGDGRSMARRAPSRVLPPIAADARFGPTWITDLRLERGRPVARRAVVRRDRVPRPDPRPARAATCGSSPIRRSATSSGSTAIAWSRTAPAAVSPARCSPWTS